MLAETKYITSVPAKQCILWSTIVYRHFPDYKQVMLPINSLVMYKGRPAIVVAADLDRISIRTIDAEEKRVRPKDVAMAHTGPISRFPENRAPDEVMEALELLQTEHPEGIPLISWKDFAELAWSDPKPEHIVIAWHELSNNPAVETLDEGIRIRSEEEQHKIRDKQQKKKEAAEAKAAFLVAFRAAWKKKDSSPIEGNSTFQPFLDELSRYARGLADDSPIARELGIKLAPQAVHEALLSSGYWNLAVNPWPERNGCIMSEPEAPLALEERKELAIDRLDLRALPSYAIDNAWSKDPDDAISVEGENVWIHVADPASIVGPFSRLDAEAMERGSTLYLPEKIIPMLPDALVQKMGLGLSAESKALSFRITLRGDGKIADISILPSMVAVQRLTYEQADAMLEDNPVLQKLSKIASVRAELRRRQNAVDIDFPEVAVHVVDGLPTFLPVPQTRSARIVQELMILAGEAAARWAFEKGIPFPFATQDPPVSENLAGCGAGPSSSLAENFMRRRSMRAALVSSTCSAHAGLGLSFYSQVTSPLRRYQDLLAHYQIHAVLAAANKLDRNNAPSEPDLLISADTMNERLFRYSDQAAKNRQAERDSRAHWTLVYLSMNPDWRGEGIVLDASAETGQIFIPQFGYEFQTRIPRGIHVDSRVSLALRRVSVPDLFASFDILPQGT